MSLFYYGSKKGSVSYAEAHDEIAACRYSFLKGNQKSERGHKIYFLLFMVNKWVSDLHNEHILQMKSHFSQIKAIYEKRHLLKEYAVFLMPSF